MNHPLQVVDIDLLDQPLREHREVVARLEGDEPMDVGSSLNLIQLLAMEGVAIDSGVIQNVDQKGCAELEVGDMLVVHPLGVKDLVRSSLGLGDVVHQDSILATEGADNEFCVLDVEQSEAGDFVVVLQNIIMKLLGGVINIYPGQKAGFLGQ